MKEWIKKAEEHILKALISGFFIVIGTGVIFYFNANHIMAQNTTKIDSLTIKVEKINNAPELNTLKINQVAKELAEQKATFKDFSKQYTKDREVIIQLLMDIKRKQ